jgi:iron-sulfur cluster assembly accessory protein
MEATSTEATSAQTPEAAHPIQLTEKAIEMVKTLRARESLGPEYALRMGVAGGGCSGLSYTMKFDNASKPDDRIIEAGDVRVVIDAEALEYLEGVTLDYVAGLHGAGFKFDNPKAQRTCGCGTSFSA